MAPIEEIRDVEILRQVALLLQKENTRLRQRLEQWPREVSALRGEPNAQASLALEIEKLQERMARLQKRLFAATTERRPRSGGEGEAKEPAAPKGHGPHKQPDLPVQEVRHELPVEERKCGVCEGELQEGPGQTEDSEEITVVERSFVLRKHRRQKHRCRCNASVVTAPAPAKLVDGGRYSVEFAVEVAAGKHLDRLPLSRQEGIMRREGLQANSQTLWDQLDALARHLQPTYEALDQRVRASPVLGADETWWRLMRAEERKRWWTWCLASADGILFRTIDSRSTEAAARVLGDYGGTVIADGLSVYRSLQKSGAGFTLVHCWAHVRRKFVEIEEHYPRECREILDLVGELYGIERRLSAFENREGPEREKALELRARLREEASRPLVAKIRDWAYAQRGTRESGLRRAIEYMLSMWEGLTRFLNEARVPLDDNAVERALRGVVVGRKNRYGSKSRRGTEVSAILYSLLETAKLDGLDPRRYLLRAAQAAIEKPGTALLPHDLLAPAEPPAAATA